jgi:hypothetical protein
MLGSALSSGAGGANLKEIPSTLQNADNLYLRHVDGTVEESSWQRSLDFGLFQWQVQALAQPHSDNIELDGGNSKSSSDNSSNGLNLSFVPMRLQLMCFVIGSDGKLFSPQEMFGASSGNDGTTGNSSESDKDCVVCLTDQKEVILLPCRCVVFCFVYVKDIYQFSIFLSVRLIHFYFTYTRHQCVCQTCFVHIDKCPVCRCAYDAYVAIDLKKRDNVFVPTSTS